MVTNALTEFSYPEESPEFLLWQASNLWQKLRRKVLPELNLTYVQFALLSGIGCLEIQQGTVNQTALSKHVGADIMMTSQVFRTLKTKGLVKRYRKPSDPRAFFLSLMDEGRGVTKEALKIVENVDADFFQKVLKNKKMLINLFKELTG